MVRNERDRDDDLKKADDAPDLVVVNGCYARMDVPQKVWWGCSDRFLENPAAPPPECVPVLSDLDCLLLSCSQL